MIYGQDKEDVKIIDKWLFGKALQSFTTVEECNTNSISFRLEFQGGDAIIFHGGSIGYENSNPWFEFVGSPQNPVVLVPTSLDFD